MINTVNNFENKIKLKFKLIQFNKFLKDNMEFIKQITPMNPAISKDDEWITRCEKDDHSGNCNDDNRVDLCGCVIR